MKHGSLFSGLGGFDYAAEQAGFTNVFHCEFNPFCQTILKYYWPDAESYQDITQTDFTRYRGAIDVLSGGFPCQGFSVAGKRKGSSDDRYLWPEMLRAIREIQPSYVLAENVPGLLTIENGLVFETVCADLEAEGYEVTPFIIPACAKGADHRRDRVWIVGYSQGNHERRTRVSERELRQSVGRSDSNSIVADTNSVKRQFLCGQLTKQTQETQQGVGNGNKRTANATNLESRQRHATNEIKPGTTGRETREACGEGVGRCGENDADAANNINSRLERETFGKTRQERITGSSSGENWLEAATRLCSLDDGTTRGLDLETISKSKWRTESLKAYGNAIYWPIAYEIFKSLC